MEAQLQYDYLMTLARKTYEMRASQRAWYLNHNRADLQRAKQLEIEVDRMLSLILNPKNPQTNLFQ